MKDEIDRISDAWHHDSQSYDLNQFLYGDGKPSTVWSRFKWRLAIRWKRIPDALAVLRGKASVEE